jgi:signal transduction histidine kinase
LQVRVNGSSYWRTQWRKLEAEGGIALRVESPAGKILYGEKSASAAVIYRPAGVTGLPWSLTVYPATQAAPQEAALARRRLLLAGLAVFAILLAAGTWLIGRAISKELAVARLQSDFVSAVSHEFRTPLTALRQLSELLARGRVSDESARQRAYEVMQGESDRLARLVESLLDFGRMQSGAFKYRFETVDAGQWAGRVVDDFRLSSRGRGRAIHFRSHGIESAIRADREALSGALWNLLDNAVKYSPEGRPVEVDLQSRDGKVEVSVRDQGLGIAEQDLKHVFDKFYRGEAAKSNGTKGTGIGLALVREIVRAHGGTVRAASATGKGSEFTLVLPWQES